MIPRYSRPEMSAVWTEENKFGAYLKVEIEAAAAWSQLGVIPAEDVEKLRTKATFDVQRIYEIEKETRHDIVAFTRAVSESLGEEALYRNKRSIPPTATSSSKPTTSSVRISSGSSRFSRNALTSSRTRPASGARTVCMPTSPPSV